jgi:hypothetical protein
MLYVRGLRAVSASLAALMIVAPAEVTGPFGLEHTDHMVAVKTAILAAAVSLAARGTRITIRRK